MKRKNIRVLVTGAGGSASSNFIDSLNISSLSCEIVAADASPHMLLLSKSDNRFVVPNANDPLYGQTIEKLCARQNIDVVWVQPDSELRVISQIRDRLPATFIPENSKITEGSDKQGVFALLQRAGVPVPVTLTGRNEDEFMDVCEQLVVGNESLWVRARRGAGSRASLPVRTPLQAINWIKWWVEERGLDWTDFQVSERLPGKEFAFQSLWQNGRLISGEARQRISYLYGFLTPSGQTSTPAIAVSTRDKGVLSQGEKSVLAFDPHPHGVYCVDMKEDQIGQLKTTEINVGRFFTTMNFLAHAGINMPEMAVRAALDEELTPLGMGNVEEDLYWIRMVDMGFKLISRKELDRLPII
jgi:hypothetical protein